MSQKKNVPNYGRQPARQITLEKRVQALAVFNSQLLQLISSHFPAAQRDAQKIEQTFAQQMAQLDAAEGDLILRGHGSRGVLESQKVFCQEDNEKFIAKTNKPAAEPLDGAQLAETLARYLMVDAGEQGRGWVIPEENMYGQLVKDGNKFANADLMEMADGIYVIKDEKQSYYTLKLTLEDGVLVFSPTTGPSLVTFSEIERRWVQHTAWQYADGPKAIAAIEAFFAKSNVNEITTAELVKLRDSIFKIPSERLVELSNLNVADDGMSIALNPIFKISFPKEGEPSIVGTRDDILWTDVTLFTRRQMFREIKSQVDRLLTTGKAPAKKAAAKKTTRKLAQSGRRGG